MRIAITGVFILFCVVATAQDSGQTSPLTVPQTEAIETYDVLLTEYLVYGPPEPSKTAEEIVESLRNPSGKHAPKLIETIRMSTLSGMESSVQFGRQVAVTTGVVASRGNTMRQSRDVQVGTIVRLTATPKMGKVAIELQFESSRLAGKETEDSPPEISTTSISTTQLMEIGKPKLIGGSTSETSTYVVLTVSR